MIGIEYNKSADIQYKYNILSGKRKEYHYYGCLKFEGDYLNGKRNGKGKEYYENGSLIFEGEYLNDKNGKVKDMMH